MTKDHRILTAGDPLVQCNPPEGSCAQGSSKRYSPQVNACWCSHIAILKTQFFLPKALKNMISYHIKGPSWSPIFTVWGQWSCLHNAAELRGTCTETHLRRHTLTLLECTHTDSLACKTTFQTVLAEARLPHTESITVLQAFLCPAAVLVLTSEFGEWGELDRVGSELAGGKGSWRKGQIPLTDSGSVAVMRQTHISLLLCMCRRRSIVKTHCTELMMRELHVLLV